ncbi:MAG: class I SAM-dependent methyltransferase [Deltaproteobacteria bacterium]|nr:class I SAM-dependent methyltransferase [Deltaproteobacteria bacterium]
MMRTARYDRIVDHYPAMWPLLVPGYVPILDAMLEVVRARPERPRRLLDLGCGPGSATVAVAEACDPRGSVVLVDASRKMMEAAKALLGGQVRRAVIGDFTEAKIARQIFEPDSYDLALVSFALHHINDADKRAVLDGLFASLIPGGLLLLADEIAAERPAGWDVVERVRARIIEEHLHQDFITKEFWDAEVNLPEEDRLPFLPCRIDDFTSWLARSGFAVSCPVAVFGSALLVAVKPRH